MIVKKRLPCVFIAIIALLTIVSLGHAQNKPVEIFVEADRLEFIGEQNIALKANIVFNQQINPFWEELQKLDFSPFKIKKMTLGERKMFDQKKDLSRDFRQATFLLSLPLSFKHGNYSIPSFALNYSYFSGKNEIKETAKSKPIKVKKAQIIVTRSLEKDVVDIGDISIIRLIIWRENNIFILNRKLENLPTATPKDLSGEEFQRWTRSLEVRGQKITNFSKPEFPGFKVLIKKDLHEGSGSVIKETTEYQISFYDLPGKEFLIPPFHIWYFYSGDPKLTPKEIITSPLPIRVNSIINPRRQSIERLKPPEIISKNNIYYFGYAPFALGGILFLISGTLIALSAIRNRRECDVSAEICEMPSEVYSHILSLKESQSFERTTIVKTRNEIFKMLGSILKISAMQSVAKTTNQMISLLTQSGFSGNSIKELKTLLSELDALIQTHQTGQDTSEAKRIISRVLAIPEISKACKKRKKFIIF